MMDHGTAWDRDTATEFETVRIAEASLAAVSEPPKVAIDTNSPAYRAIERLVDDLRDGLDHPDLWALLHEVVAVDDHHDLFRLLVELRPLQHDNLIARIFDLVAATIHALAIDRDQGIAMLRRMEALDGASPQIAGVLFFFNRLTDPSKAPDLSTKFCEAPFKKFETLIDGTVAPCCSIWTQKRLGKLGDSGFEDIWNSIDAQEMRESILDGSFRYCNKQRCTHIVEDTLPERDAITEPTLRTIIDEGKTALDSKPEWLFLAHDWTCNLSCPSCRGEILAATEAQERRFETIEREVFHPLLHSGKEILISASGQGDPWSSQHYRSLLRYMADHDLNARLNLHTNALLMTEQKWEPYIGLERYHPLVDVSIDSCTPWVYAVVRRPGKWERLEPNLKFIARKRAAGIFREFHINATIQLDNYHEMPEMVDYAQTIGADTVRMYMMQDTGGHLSPDFARKNIASADHPLHFAFLETLRDARLGHPAAHLYDVGHWRQAALDTSLPSDRFHQDDPVDSYEAAIAETAAREKHDIAVALCAAARSHFGNSIDLLQAEARSLEALGFEQQAGYRRLAAKALDGRVRDLLLVS
jgi:MoaA/NifB/PqqE/SkfB family radical SAM enzyme